jgi:threonine dehydrogenase-like Zn-dependent dehydrogenase
MAGVVFRAPGLVELADRPAPVPRGPRDVLVRVRATGICGTDRAIALGDFPATPGVILGHETVGDVVATGPAVRDATVGDRVVVNPTYFCGACPPCQRGRAAYCRRKHGREVGVDCDGAMAELIVVEAGFVHPVPPRLPYRRAALVEPLACVLANLRAAGCRCEDRALVAGAGPIGALCALVLAARGTRVVLAERDLTRVGIAREVLPAAVRVAAVPDGELRQALAAGDPRPDVVVDTTGLQLTGAVEVVADGGTVVVMGEREAAVATVPVRPIVTRGIRVVGAGPYPPDLFHTALDLAADLPMERLVTHELPLARAIEGLALLDVDLAGAPASPGGYRAGKVLVVPEGWDG